MLMTWAGLSRQSIVVTSGTFESWKLGLEGLFACFAGRFARVEPRRYAFAYVRGLFSPLERKNGWTVAEMAGFRSPNGVLAELVAGNFVVVGEDWL
jgi:hypothetical protein